MARLNPETRRRIFALALTGQPVPEIAKELGLSTRTVYRALADPLRAGLPPHVPRRLAQTLKLAYEQGPTLVEELARLATDPNLPPETRARAGAALLPLVIYALKVTEAGYGRLLPETLPY
jgi:transposase-like protein